MATTHYERSDRAPFLEVYLKEIQDDPLLSSEEEGTLAHAIADGDREAHRRMVQANLRLVVKIARQFQGHGLPLDDLIGEGNLGLIRAAHDFNPRFGTRFSTYAAYWIKQAIRSALTNTTATIRLPAHMVGLLSRWKHAERMLRRGLERDPTFFEIAESLRLTTAQRDMVRHALQTRRLIHEGHCDHNRDASWFSEDTRDDRASHETECEAAEELRALRQRLRQLEPRERIVVTLRFGLEGNRPLTLQEVGKQLGVTREWVRKIELRAVRKLDTRVPAWRRSRKSTPRAAKTASNAVREAEAHKILAQTA